MSNDQFSAFVVDEENDRFIGRVKTKSMVSLPENDLLVKVRYSSLNYKDALSASGNKGVTKNYPHTPGIDAVGTVVSSDNANWSVGESVIVTSFDLGMNTAGGFAQYIRVPSEWALKLPNAMTMQESMILGTAGLTAGISILKLTGSVKPGDGKIIVSGATGGVGALSINILAKLGYNVVAVSGKDHEAAFLNSIGASEIIARKEFEKEESRPILKAKFAGAIDTVGGVILENIIKSTQPSGVITCCGNVASVKLNTTVLPFILRGISLMGVDSQNYAIGAREVVWEKLAGEWKPEGLMELYREITLEALGENISLMLSGQLKGRTIVNMEP